MLESHCWKEYLSRIAKRLDRWKTQRRWSERSICIFERDILIAFFCIRKLIEAGKLTVSHGQALGPVGAQPEKPAGLPLRRTLLQSKKACHG